LTIYASSEMLMAAYLPETSPIATPDQIILVLGDFPGDVWLDHGVILVATLGCDHLRSSGVATHMGEERIARNSVNFTWLNVSYRPQWRAWPHPSCGTPLMPPPHALSARGHTNTARRPPNLV